MTHLDNITQTADLGLRFASSDMAARPTMFSPRHPGAFGEQTAVTGAYMIDVEPKMQQIRVSADALNDDVNRNVADPVFKKHWTDWYTTWQKFYDDTHGLWVRLFSNPLHADEIDRQVESYRQNLLGWYDAYARQIGLSGAPVPRPSGQPPIPGREPDKGSSGAGLPWWFWALSGVAVVGVGYLVYRKIGEGRAKAAYVHKHGPGILEKYLGPLGKPAYEYSQAGRDAHDPNYMVVDRDPALTSRPFQLSAYTRDPSAGAAVHRGFPIRDHVIFEEPQRDLPRPPRYFEVDRDPYDYDLAYDYAPEDDG